MNQCEGGQTHTKAPKCPCETFQYELEDVLSLLDFASEIGRNNTEGRALLTEIENHKFFKQQHYQRHVKRELVVQNGVANIYIYIYI